MSCYPPETIRALDAKADAWDHAERMQAMHVELFTDAVKTGADVQLLWPYSRGERKTYPVSTYLGECGDDKAKALLFKACAAAMTFNDAGTVLREFVAHVAADYAKDCIEMWGAE
jgi:hypothetical protein